MKFAAILLALLAVATSVSAAPTNTNQPKGLFKLEPGMPNGWYTHHVALDGSVITQYHGELNRTAPAPASSSSNNAKRAAYGAYCQTLTFEAQDGQNAIAGLASTLNTNNQFYHAISYSSGTAVTYGCDYGSGQSISGGDMQSYLTMVQNQCGNTKAGWFSVPDWRASYGITTTGESFC